MVDNILNRLNQLRQIGVVILVVTVVFVASIFLKDSQFSRRKKMKDNRLKDFREAIDQLDDAHSRRNGMLILYKLSKRDPDFFIKLDRKNRSKIIELLKGAVGKDDALAYGTLLDLFPSVEMFDWMAEPLEKLASIKHDYVVRDILYCCSVHPEMVKESGAMLIVLRTVKEYYPEEVKEVLFEIDKIEEPSPRPGGA